MNNQPDKPTLAPLNLRASIRHAVRSLWDTLGLACAVSLAVFSLAIVGASTADMLCKLHMVPTTVLGIAVGLGVLFCVIAPTVAGAGFIAYRAVSREQAVFADLLYGFRRLYRRAVALILIDTVVTAVLIVNIAFYISRPSLPSMMLAMLVVYVFIFWLMNAIYHLPLLIAGELGIVKRDDGGPSRLSAVYKNGFLLTASSPAYTFGVTLTLLGMLLILTISGFGLALLGCSFATYLTTSATRDQLVRLGMLEPLPDIDSKVVEERWRLKKD